MILPRVLLVSALCLMMPFSAARAEMTTICTAAADTDSDKVLKQEGACTTRATAASTFKIAISLMGYDSGILKDAHAPNLPFKAGYPAWNPSWKSPADPSKWMRDSVVWYSQQITMALGQKRFSAYVRSFQYGNQDASGDPGKNDGLSKSWIGSSLEISPLEQLVFLRKLVRRELPVSAHAYSMTEAIMDVGRQPNGWHVFGKTGAGASKDADGTKVLGKPWAWFVGWAKKGDRTIVFTRLTKGTSNPSISPGPAVRKAVLEDLFALGRDL